MYARVTTTQFSPYRLEEAISIIREGTVPAAQKQEGFKGYLLLVDRSTGKGITITLWEEEKDRECTGPNSDYYRQEIGKVVPLLTDAPMTGGSVTPQQIGFEAVLISGQHPWRNFKADLLAEKDPAKQSAMRRQGALAEFYLGSVNALAETGELIFASGTGSQLPAYAYTSRNVIWVAGTQKITPTLDDALRRVREYVLPLEDERQKKFGNKTGSYIGRILIFEYEPAFLRRSLTLILVNQVLGF